LVDSTFTGKTSEDLRVAFALGEIALVYHKHKPLDDRFGTHYLSVDVMAAEDVFSPAEINLIIKFCDAMGLDFGAIDVMRDKHDGRIYIVDVNKTCMPVLSLTLAEQIKSQQKIADSLLRGLANIN
jgi:glutathione synthase/RimK-type ligase-like ATP-grasp enzyme